MDKMFNHNYDGEYDEKHDKHNEEGERSKKLDDNDSQNITYELKKNINPLKSETENLANIINWGAASDKINVQDALVFGERVATKFKCKLITIKIIWIHQ